MSSAAADPVELDAVSFRVDGVPAPQGSKTVAQTRAGASFVRDDNPHLKPWRSAVAASGREAMRDRPPLTGPLELEVEFRFPRPRAHYGTGRNAGTLKASAPGWCDKRPDLDKLLRAVGDALTGIVWVDDAAIAALWAGKSYGQPGALIYVRGLDDDEAGL